jgi:N utilization substance protein A
MSKVLVASINQIATEKDLDREVIYEAIEAALVSAYKRNYGAVANVTAKVDRLTGEMRVFAEREVVEDVFNQQTEIAFKDAIKQAPTAQIGDVIMVETRTDDFGRIAAQTAKQVILQRIREAERDTVFENFSHKVNEVLTAQVRSVDTLSGALTLVLDDKHEILLPREEQIPIEKVRRGEFMKVYLVDVHKSSRGPMIKISRTHRNLLRRLMEMEIPEVRDGIVELKGIAREPGQRSKAAVIATRPGVDPVGSCVGPRGLRIQNIVNELAGEKIDVIEWSSDPATYITNALSPAKISYVLPDEKSSIKTAVVVVPDKQLSLAIGKEGQNARLAAKLTGWRIDIKSESEAAAEGLDASLAERVKRGKGADLLSYVEQLLKGDEQPVGEDLFARAAMSLGDGSTKSGDVSEPLDFGEDETKRVRKVKRIKSKASEDPKEETSELSEGVPSFTSSELETAFLRGLEAAQSSEKPQQSSEQMFGDMFKSLEETPAFIEPAPTDILEEVKPIEAKPVDPKPAKAKPIEAKPIETKPVEVTPAEAPSSEAKSDELPEVITAAMLRERMAQMKGKAVKPAEIEVPDELLAGYEEKDEDVKPVSKDAKGKPVKASAAKADKKPKKKKWRPVYDEDDDFSGIS